MQCPTCGAGIERVTKFCPECGAPLPQPTARAREVRKAVSVVICERMQAVLESHGGTVEKFIGDAVMAVFAIPVLHEDDALRAVRAAAGMREAWWLRSLPETPTE